MFIKILFCVIFFEKSGTFTLDESRDFAPTSSLALLLNAELIAESICSKVCSATLRFMRKFTIIQNMFQVQVPQFLKESHVIAIIDIMSSDILPTVACAREQSAE